MSMVLLAVICYSRVLSIRSVLDQMNWKSRSWSKADNCGVSIHSRGSLIVGSPYNGLISKEQAYRSGITHRDLSQKGCHVENMLKNAFKVSCCFSADNTPSHTLLMKPFRVFIPDSLNRILLLNACRSLKDSGPSQRVSN